MSKFTKMLFVLGLLLGSIFIYAINTDKSFTNYLLGGFLSTDETTELVTSKETVTLLANNTNALFSDDFEGTASNWTFINGTDNPWIIGTAVKNGGTKSLYITNDGGTTNAYSSDETVNHAVSKSIAIPVGAKDAEVRFDWRAEGEGYSWMMYDYLDVWIVPSSYTPIAGTELNTTNSGGMAVKVELFKQSTFKTEVVAMDLSKFAGTSVNLVFQWANDDFGSYPPAAAIDNVSLSVFSCTSIDGFKATPNTQTQNSLEVEWVLPTQTGKNVELYLSTSATPPTATTTGVSTVGNTHKFSSLTANTLYYIWNRSSCSATDVGMWMGPLAIRTSCGVVDLPFWEGFNSDSNSIVCWTIKDENKDSTSPTSSGIFKTTTTAFEGSHSMYLYGYTTDQTKLPHNDWLITPVLKYNPNKTYRLKYQYRTDTTTSYDYEFEVLLSDKGGAVSDFSKVIVPKKKYPASSAWVEEYVFFTGVTADFQLAWHVTSATSSTYLYIDNVFIEEVTGCVEPTKLSVSNLTDVTATLNWTDNFNTSWEYYVQEEGIGSPIATQATSTTQKTANITQDSAGNLLVGNTIYEFYVRSNCGTGQNSIWTGPFKFTTKCSPIATLPFEETFNTTSTTFACWTIVDNKPNSTSATNTWRQYQYSTYEGDRTMYFSASGTPNDDWLISPTVALTGGIYEVSYYYMTSSSSNTEYEVLLSTTGTDLNKFTTTVMAKKKAQVGSYTKVIHYVTGVTGNANIAIRVVSSGFSSMYLDKFRIEAIDCIAPDQEVKVSGVSATTATMTWTDTFNSSWEYAVVAANATAPTTGSSTANKSVTVTQTTGTGGANLQPNTEYDFYVRSSCSGANKSKWIGPIRFRTLCSVFNAPYWEGFNTDSTSMSCWTRLNLNGTGTWNTTTTRFEGTHSMYLYNYSSTSKHDAWLMSPNFAVVANKYYRLRYHYRTNSFYKNSFDVLSSSTGVDVAEFKTKLLTKTNHSSDNWVEERITVSSTTAGNIAFAWHINSTDPYTYFYIDNVFFEEITCPEPYNLDIINLTDKAATLNWTDNYGSNWEYLVQEKGKAVPTATDSGTATTSKSVNITATTAGVNLKANTEYEYYVRTICSATNQSDWIGPLTFRTDCGAYDLPFWEGFNGDSETKICWNIVDANGDSTSPTGSGIWRPSTTAYEGTHSMYLYAYTSDANKLPHNDWLISPRMKYSPGKTYRLKYHYRTTTTASYDYEFEVLLSDKGGATSNFTKVVVPKKKYPASSNWVEEYVFFTGPTADFQLAWHVTSTTPGTYLYVDNVFIEEVEGCPEPLVSSFGVKDIGKKEATLTWNDTFGATSWEYYVQEAGATKPGKTDKGTGATKKEAIVTKDGKGNNLKGNTDYEFYIRTDCGNGSFSIWNGPFKFTTLCDVYETPFWEGFNSKEVQYRCWSTMDKTGAIKAIVNPWSFSTSAFEGDRAVYFSLNNIAKTPFDDWLISPEINLDGGQYILKYHYKTNVNATYNPEFEVVLSVNGIDAKEFKKVLVPSSVKRVGDYVEEVVFFSGVTGKANIAWHVNAKDTQYSHLYLDNINLKKVSTCPEPYAIKTTNPTSTAINVAWTQTGGVTSWEVIVVPYGEPITATPIKTVQVTGNPSTTITGLEESTAYTVYVIAKCDADSKSDPSTPVHFATKMGTNTGCQSALTIPITNNTICESTVNGSLFGAVANLPAPTCNASLVKDAWFEFTATQTSHLLNISDMLSLTKQNLSVNVALYNQPCSGITGANAVSCYVLSVAEPSRMLANLVVGQKYFIRVGVAGTVVTPDIMFKLCLSNPKYIDVSSQPYTPEQLVKDVLVVSDCDLVSNVTSRSGHNFGGINQNGIGYFTNESNLFPFKEGIVLATNGRQYTSGPTNGTKGSNDRDWLGDSDLNALLVKNGRESGNHNASVLEFDFIPVIENIEFNFLFASDEYGSFQCSFADVFAFFLTDLETGEVINIAVIPGTNIPVSVTTIRDENFNTSIGMEDCTSQNKAYFGEYFDSGMSDPEKRAKMAVLNPINYKGMTVPMAAKAKVKPGKKYHIKLAIANYSDTAFQSAVFLEGGSFNLGSLDLGADLTIENGTALCNGEAREINSGLPDDPTILTISWFKDDVLVVGENKPVLSVTETGTYKVVGHYNEISCDVEGKVFVEIFPPIHEVVNQASNLTICRFTTETTSIDLTLAVANVFAKPEVNSENYSLVFYEDALAEVEIDKPEVFELDHRNERTIYYKITDNRTTCEEIFSFKIRPEIGEVPTKPADVSVCESYELPATEANQFYYTEAGGKGISYKGGDVLGVGVYQLFLFQDNGGFCYEEVGFKVEVTERIELMIIKDQLIECDVYVLPELPKNNKYFIEIEGIRVPAEPNTPILLTNTRIFIVAESDNKICYDETSFVVRYNECPIPKGFSPNGDGLNDRLDLSKHGVTSLQVYNRNGVEVYSFKGQYTNEWDGKSKSGSDLPSGTYYYVIKAYENTRTGWIQIQR